MKTKRARVRPIPNTECLPCGTWAPGHVVPRHNCYAVLRARIDALKDALTAIELEAPLDSDIYREAREARIRDIDPDPTESESEGSDG